MQSTVETATYGSEYSAGRTAKEQIVDLRLTLRYLGVPFVGPSFLFGDNESVVKTANNPDAKMMKRHNALSYHAVREAMAAKYLRFHHVRSGLNPADILSKHWDRASVWPQLQPLMFWAGDTKKCPGPKTSQPSKKG